MRPLVVLGVTGSIGLQTLDVARQLDIPVAAMASGRGTQELIDLALEWPDAAVAVADPSPDARRACSEALGSRVSFGGDTVDSLAAEPDRIVVNGIVGAAGLSPSMAAARAGNRLALANKESLVAGGDVLTAAIAAGGAEIIPVDSEHSALWQCLVGEPARVRRLILTASGGPFRGRSRASLGAVTVDDALAHPTWAMGSRITIDSSTLMNKAFEVIEAHHLFGIEYDDIDVVVHPQSIVHSMVEFIDGSVKAQLGDPDMRLPIQYAVAYPDRAPSADRNFDITKQDLTFEPPDGMTFRLLGLGYAAGRQSGSAPAVLNAADEVAVAAFLDGKIGYLDIEAVVEHCLEAVDWRPMTTVEDVLVADADAREAARIQIEASPRST
ncbi:MAG: 1-deoxy-D-xylulose-5-phosphate reductoisomerase [bacterium]|nr:1-deoxy-D-xylulose-5-phosphate reductoisomerase [bacterium]